MRAVVEARALRKARRWSGTRSMLEPQLTDDCGRDSPSVRVQHGNGWKGSCRRRRGDSWTIMGFCRPKTKKKALGVSFFADAPPREKGSNYWYAWSVAGEPVGRRAENSCLECRKIVDALILAENSFH